MNSPRKSPSLLTLAACLALAGCGDNLDPIGADPDAGVPTPDAPSPVNSIIRPENPIPGHYLFLLDAEQVPPPSVQEVADELTADRGVVQSIMDGSILAFMANELDDESALAILEDPRVTGVGQDGYLEVDWAPTPLVDQNNPVWGLDRIDQSALPFDDIYQQNTTGAGVHAYIIDTGVNAAHSEFAGRMGNGMSAILDGGGTADCQGHGSHVAGTVGGTQWGVAKDVTIHAVRALGCDGRGSLSGVIKAVDWVTMHHVKPAVVNMSLGSGRNDLVNQAVQASIDAGLIYAVAAGNENTDSCNRSPASVGDALTVGASDIEDTRAWFSNFGSCVDLFAPGVDITSSLHNDNSGSRTISGTSMATPHVAGVIALYLESHPDATQAEVNAALIAAATPDVIADPQGSPNLLLYSLFIDPPVSPCVADPGAPGCDQPASCAEVLARDPAATDGEYTLYIGGDEGQPWTAYCHDMAGTPAEYLTLVNTGGDSNFGQYTAGGSSPGTNVRTSYTRVRIDPADMSIVIVDKTFSTSTGSLDHGGTAVDRMSYAIAMSCDSSDSGVANVDLRGTPFAIDGEFCQGGFNSVGGTTVSANDQVADLTGGGFCGYTAPVVPGAPNCPGGFNDQPSQHRLPLRYLAVPASCAEIKAANAGAADGEYTLYVDRDESKPWTAYCHDMDGTPSEFLSLPSGADKNFAQYTGGGATPGESVRTSYSRVRINPKDLSIDILDQTFASSSGSLVHGGQPVNFMPYGVAMSCDQSASGVASIDLSGTPFAVAGEFCQAGWRPQGASTPSQGGQVVEISGGGYCGWSAPSGQSCPYNPFNANPQNAVISLSYQ
ncbi:S8 family serine peptidase [Haliangium ochraceum]|uniref:Peptidase S8 and S53 subtilisin kexin sedolisin n=1 Tax=Haliangium ochraceum (strain DSM 14365 / JCM 11303 / SMP-2) TaxID=502025 RepID=D0LR61_HALO1|nr:S8 family serine peptidase [Haliangium ochraceum]ACY15569.1 peptidase S8 and S53 subtilisin kexin sedolisin [Haliangium ochraceum DSM 14365]